MERAHNGDESAVPELLEFLDRFPDISDRFGDVGRNAFDILVRAIFGSNHLICQSVLRKVTELKAKLAGPTPSPVVKLLAERAALCWLVMSVADNKAAREPCTAADLRRTRWTESWQRRYLAALRALAPARLIGMNYQGVGQQRTAAPATTLPRARGD